MRKSWGQFRRWWPLFAAVAVALAAWNAPGILERLRQRARSPATAVAAPLALAARAGAAALDSSTEAERLRTELSILKLEYAALKERLEREHLRGGKLAFPRQRLAKLRPAALLFRDPATWFRFFSLDVGSDDEVRLDAGVLNAWGVVGKLSQVGARSSQVLLLSDPACRFSAKLTRTGLQCAVAGDGRRGALLQHLGGQDDVRVGDVVETGAGSRSFPSGVPVGKVVRVSRLDGGLKLLAEVEPAAPLNKLEGLYVWIGEPKP